MNLLAIETATDNCSVALLMGNELIQRQQLAPQQHTALLLPMINEVLAEAGLSRSDLEVVAFGRGPGSFTGVRLAIGVAQGIGMGLDIPLVAISTLAALAQGTGKPRVYAALDARQNEIYCGLYAQDSENRVKPMGQEVVTPPGEAPTIPGNDWFGAGPGWASYAEQLSARLGDQLAGIDPSALPNAKAIAILAKQEALLGKTISPEKAIPTYLRNKVTDGEKARKPA